MKNSAPEHLSAEAQAWWGRLMAEYSLDDEAALLLLQTALEAYDRMKACQARINTDGELIMDRFDQLKPHPLLSAERDARAQMLAALKALNLDVEPLKAVGRPPGKGGWKGDH